MELQQIREQLRKLYNDILYLKTEINDEEDLAGFNFDDDDDREYNRGQLSGFEKRRDELEKMELVMIRDLEDQRTIRLVMLDQQIATLTESIATYTREVASGDNSARKWISRLSGEKGGVKKERAALIRKLKRAGLAVQ